MPKSEIPANAYTYAPEQHPNLIIGSLQLLFWLVFRPMAWENHLKRIDSSFDKNVYLLQLLKNHRWRQPEIRRFFIQGFILLPVLLSLFMGLISWGLGTPLNEVAYGVAYGVAVGLTGSLAYGVASGVAYGVALSVALGVAVGVAVGLTGGVALGVAGNLALGMIAGGVAHGVAEGVASGVAYGVALGVASGVASGVVAGNVALGVAVGVAVGVGLWVNWWRPVLLTSLFTPWHWLLYRFDQSRNKQLPSLLHKHLAFWDEWQYLPIPGLDKHLLLTLEKRPAEGQAALDYLSTSRQRWAAQAAQIELDARQLECCEDAASVGDIHHRLTVGELQGPADTLLRSFTRISTDVAAALNQDSNFNQRLALSSIADRLDGLVRELTRSSDKYVARFRPIAQRWGNIIDLTIEDLTKESELRQEIDSPYIIGVPLNQQQTVFISRTGISARIEQLLLDRRRPPLLLYGQRRSGKTSLLNNLGRLLPNNIVPLFVDLQGASSATSYSGFLSRLAGDMVKSAQEQRSLTLPTLTREELIDDPFTIFHEWLNKVETLLKGDTGLLALDEFEKLDEVLTEGRFRENDILGMLRNIIQHRPRFKVMIAGSHTLKEFQRWSSYLINAQTIHLGYLKESEARQLIEHPIKDFALRYEPDASQRVLDVTHGHPFLVQLLCGEVVAYKNEQDPSIRRLATLADVEAAIPEALESGSMFFSDIEGNQVDATALAILRHIAALGEGGTASQPQLVQQISDDLAPAIDLLLRRELIEATADGYRFQVELIRRWFARS
ncbi:MAG: AAA family ATPase [Cyanobacteria bacterium P01_F01_bin.116]